MSQLCSRNGRKRRTGIAVFVMFCMWGSLHHASLSAQTRPSEVIAYADIVFHNGKVITADDQFSIAEAVALRDGKVLAVGDSQRILAMAGPETRKVDLAGRSVIPGLIVTHEHSYIGNSSKAGVRFKSTELPGIVKEIEAVVAKLSPGEHAYFSGPSIAALMCHNLDFDQAKCLSLKQLDTLAPNNPLAIVLQNNQVIVNSQMLELLPSLDVSGVLKDEQGRPTGQLRGGAGGIVAYEIMPWHDNWLTESVAEERENMKQWPVRGVTTLMGRAQGQAISILRELWAAGELNTRLRFAHEFLRQNPRAEIFLKRVGNLTDVGDDWFKIVGATTQAADGTAFTKDYKRLHVLDHDPYGPLGNDKWGETGDLATSDRQNIILANRYGWSLMGYHTAGDAANDRMLEAFAEAHKERSLVGRNFSLDHNEMILPRHFALMKEMDIMPNLRGYSFTGDNSSFVDQFGADSVSDMAPVKSVIEAGFKPSIEEPGGLESIQDFLTRQTDDGRVWNPEERVSRKEALWMYTRWAARYSGEQDRLGSIEPGKLGDLVVLGGDYMTWPAEDIGNLRVLMTVVGGKIVYEASGAF